MRQSKITLCCIAFLSALSAPAQELPRPIVTNPDPNLSVNLPMQRVGPEDLLSVNVYDAPEFTRTVRISLEGTIRLPMMKAQVQVSGLLPSEIETRVGQQLQREGLLVDPFVTVNVAEYHSRPVNVVGAVKNPLIFQAVGNVTLLDAIARAGGLDPVHAGPDIVITRADDAGGAGLARRISVKRLMQGNEPDLNLKLIGGEAISVPQVSTIVVEGSVIKPGIYPVQDPLSLNTVTTAIAQAGGLAQYADHKAYIYRTDEEGLRHTIEVPLWDIQNRKKPDVILQARDILQIPDSPKRRITQAVVTTATGTAAGAVLASIYVFR
jgi:polysaccharide export outer membrane protein